MESVILTPHKVGRIPKLLEDAFNVLLARELEVPNESNYLQNDMGSYFGNSLALRAYTSLLKDKLGTSDFMVRGVINEHIDRNGPKNSDYWNVSISAIVFYEVLGG